MLQILRKKGIFLALILAFSSSVFAQKTNTPIKPFSGNKWFNKFTVGVNAGVLKSSVLAGGSNDFSKNILNFGFGINAKYQLTHSIAFQTDFIHGTLSGNQDKKRGNNQAYTDKTITSFKTKMHVAASMTALYTFNNINWLHLKNWIVPYIGVGAGFVDFNVKIVKKDSAFSTYYPNGEKNNIKELFIPVVMGVRVKLTKLVNLDIGYTMHYTDADNLNGFTYWNVPLGHSSTVHKDKFSYTHVGLEFALGKKSKPQLLFDNPAARLNNSLESQIKNLTVKVDSLMNKQKSLDDTDGDGVADLFDKEPNTPPGCPVDAQGMLRDTDGDGVVDCKDKQLITPTECQPVDADGVGKCPDPACCKGRTGDGDTDADGNLNANCPSDYPALSFRGNSSNLSNETRAIIAVIATTMKARPDCKIMIKGNAETSKSSQAVCQKRVDAIRKQLREKEGISAERITTNCEVGGAGDKNVVEISTN